MIKYIGIFLVMISSAGAAYMNTRSYKTRLNANEGMLEFIRYIRARILYFKDPLTEIFYDYENKTLEDAGFLKSVRGVGFGKSLENYRVMRFFDGKTAEALKTFSNKLGKTSAEEQIDNCDLCIEALSSVVEKMRRELPQKTGMYSSLCVIAGLGASLLLI
ncbi:MAG: stage III sporulation protein AB [Clostridia bacterium]|nr:stage III sporulation protein AB [Clostridia bacterium]